LLVFELLVFELLVFELLVFELLVFELLVFELLVRVSFKGVSVNVLMSEQWRLRALPIRQELNTVERLGIQLLREFFHLPKGLFTQKISRLGGLLFHICWDG
jgi:hypothetical protein